LIKRKTAVQTGPGRPPIPFEKRREVVECWLQLGNMKLAAEICGVHLNTIKGWKSESWWKQLEDEIKVAGRLQTGAKLSHIVNKALVQVEDRLDNGEVVLDQKTGELVRRPVAMRDAANAAVTLMQRQQVLENLNNQETNTDATKSIQEQLAMLATEFAKFNNRSKANAETIEYREVTDADERVVVEAGEQGEVESVSEEDLFDEDGESDESFTFGQHT
jgi:hypothetical protein